MMLDFYSKVIFHSNSDDTQQRDLPKAVRYTGATGSYSAELVFPADASTDVLPYFDFSSMIKDVDQTLELLKQQLENDEDTDFNSRMYNIVTRWGIQPINRIISLIKSSQIRGLFVSKLLQSLGDIVHPSTHLHRRNALESSLFDDSPRVRDGACLGLSVMNDASSLPYVIIAAQREDVPTLKQNLQSLIIQLQHGKKAGTFYTRST